MGHLFLLLSSAAAELLPDGLATAEAAGAAMERLYSSMALRYLSFSLTWRRSYFYKNKKD